MPTFPVVLKTRHDSVWSGNQQVLLHLQGWQRSCNVARVDTTRSWAASQDKGSHHDDQWPICLLLAKDSYRQTYHILPKQVLHSFTAVGNRLSCGGEEEGGVVATATGFRSGRTRFSFSKYCTGAGPGGIWANTAAVGSLEVWVTLLIATTAEASRAAPEAVYTWRGLDASVLFRLAAAAEAIALPFVLGKATSVFNRTVSTYKA